MKVTKYFTAPWCGPCRSFKPVVHEVISEGYDIEEINVDEETELATKYGIMSVPTLLVLDVDEQKNTETVLDVLYGAVSKEELISKLSQ